MLTTNNKTKVKVKLVFNIFLFFQMLKGDIHRPVATLFRRDDY